MLDHFPLGEVPFLLFPTLHPPMCRKIWIESSRRSFQLLGLLWILSGWSEVCEAQAPPMRLLALGDSLTKGSNPDSADPGGYRNRLQNLLSNASYNVDWIGTQTDSNNPSSPDPQHQGMTGYRIDQIQAGLAGWLNATEDPDVVLLLIGTDDLGQGGSLSDAQDRLANLVGDIASKRPYAKIILSSLPLRIDNPDLEILQSTFNQSIPEIVSAQVALGRQLTFVDMQPLLEAADLSSDGIHPNSTGYDKMADAWLPAITSVIAPTGTSSPPSIVRIEPLTDRYHVTVKFSKPLADDSVDLANFSIAPGLTISQALLDPSSKRSITLTTDAQMPETLYTLTMSGLCDATPERNPIAPETTVTFLPQILINGSFEAGLIGWDFSGHLGVSYSTRYNTQTDGIRVAAFNGANLSPNATLAQTFETTAGQAYTLAFDLGVFSYGNTNSQMLQVTATGTNRLLSRTITLNGNGRGESLWVPQSFTFVADSSATTLTFRDLSLTTTNVDLIFDDLRINPTALPPGDFPTAIADAYSTDQDTTLVVLGAGVLANDSSSTSNPLTAVLDMGPSHGSLQLNANGSFIYRPEADFTGVDSFTYSAVDTSLSSNLVSVEITLNATAAPVLVNGSFESDYAGWTVSGNQDASSQSPYDASDGAKLVAFNGGDSAADAVLSQSFTTVAGQVYVLAFDAGVFAYTLNQQTLGLDVAGTDNLLAETVTITPNTRGVNDWTPQSFTFVADSSTTTLTFRDRSEFTNGLDLLLDHVRVIPVPSIAHTMPITRLPTDGTTPAPVSLDAPTLKITPTTVAIGTAAYQKGSYGLERSEDLVTWESLGEIQITAVGRIEFHDLTDSPRPAAARNRRFYRISLTPSE